jgi:hypothetical protein
VIFCLGLQAHKETYTRDATAVSEKHSEEVDLDMPSMVFRLETGGTEKSLSFHEQRLYTLHQVAVAGVVICKHL